MGEGWWDARRGGGWVPVTFWSRSLKVDGEQNREKVGASRATEAMRKTSVRGQKGSITWGGQSSRMLGVNTEN